jgi:cardiolipin synthase
MDYWSLLSNDEANAVILSHEFAQEMEKTFAKNLAEFHQIKLAEWEARPLSAKMRQWFAHLFIRWL